MSNFYVNIDNEQKGPFEIDDLKSQKINKNTLVWFEGMADWKKAGDMPELKELFASIPPPIINSNQYSSNSMSNDYYQMAMMKKKNENKSTQIIFIVIGVIVFLGIVGYIASSFLFNKVNDAFNQEISNSSYQNQQQNSNNPQSGAESDFRKYLESFLWEVCNVENKENVSNLTKFPIYYYSSFYDPQFSASYYSKDDFINKLYRQMFNGEYVSILKSINVNSENGGQIQNWTYFIYSISDYKSRGNTLPENISATSEGYVLNIVEKDPIDGVKGSINFYFIKTNGEFKFCAYEWNFN